LTSTFDEFGIPMKKFLVNTTQTIHIHTPTNTVRCTGQKEYVISRTAFDQYLAQRAEDAGATLFVNHHFMHRKGKNTILVKDKSKNIIKEIHCDAIIGADGPLSKTAREWAIFHPDRQYYQGIQATVKGQFDADSYRVFFGNSVTPDLFAWVVPEDDTTARVGLATLHHSPRSFFTRFLRKNNFRSQTALQAGIIPLYNPHQIIAHDGCFLVGDAATQVKATTLGGIIPGMKAAESLALSITHGNDYLAAVRHVTFQLWLHLQLRKMFDRFSDDDWDRLATIMNRETIQNIIRQHTRERPSSILLRAIVREPRLLAYAKYLLPLRGKEMEICQH
jgi:flavin-dependent dehydrogenase